MAVSSNLQGAATLIGDPPSMLLAGAAGLSFNDFFFYGTKPGIFFATELGALVSTFVLFLSVPPLPQTHACSAKGHVFSRSYRPCWYLPDRLAHPEFVVTARFPVHDGVALCDLRHALLLSGMYFNLMAESSNFSSPGWTGKPAFSLPASLSWWKAYLCSRTPGRSGRLHAPAQPGLPLGRVLAYCLVLGDPQRLYRQRTVSDRDASGSSGADSGSGSESLSPVSWRAPLGASVGGNITPSELRLNIVAMGIMRKQGYKVRFFEFVRIGLPFTIFAVTRQYVVRLAYLRTDSALLQNVTFISILESSSVD